MHPTPPAHQDSHAPCDVSNNTTIKDIGSIEDLPIPDPFMIWKQVMQLATEGKLDLRSDRRKGRKLKTALALKVVKAPKGIQKKTRKRAGPNGIKADAWSVAKHCAGVIFFSTLRVSDDDLKLRLGLPTEKVAINPRAVRKQIDTFILTLQRDMFMGDDMLSRVMCSAIVNVSARYSLTADRSIDRSPRREPRTW